MKEDQTELHRRSIRLKGYDYTLEGAYFVTIVTANRAKIFGEVIGNHIILNKFGEIARDEWFISKLLRNNVDLFPKEFIVMPNHIHGIIWMTDINQACRGAATLRPYNRINEKQHQNVTPHSLGAIVRAYKSAVSYKINALRKAHGMSVWQRNYYEHIIRNQDEHAKIDEYITANAENWMQDPEYQQ
jgi:putative transposase